jgi:ppGpp synthetase/RelA/SpoT-type nucleotidyltranferase
MFRLKTELEDEAFRTLYPRSHSMVSSLRDTTDVGEGMKSVLSDISNQMKRLVQEDLYFMEHIDSVSITARLKEPYSIWRKMVKMSKRGDVKLSDISILDIPDAVALRVVFSARKLTEDESDAVTKRREQALCYYILNLCTATWPETSNSRFKDYVVTPKANGYQSLHYSSCKRWRGSDCPFEVQIRSSEMHRVAEYGVAAHWSYKRNDIDPPSNPSLSNQRILDKSSQSYLKSVQEYRYRESMKSYIAPEVEPEEPMYIEDEIRRDRKRERDERLAPYLEALSGAQMDMTRENVYVFVSLAQESSESSSESSSSNTQGTVLSLPRGSRVLDAIRAAEKWSAFPISKKNGTSVLRNGRHTAEQTEQLVNGDVISISANVEGVEETGLAKHLFSVV